MNDLTTTNMWLAVLAIVSVLEFLMIVVAGVFAFNAYKKLSAAVDSVERVHIAPLRARVDLLLDDVEVITGKVKHAQDSMGAAFDIAGAAGSIIADTVRSRTWPILGIVKGVQMAARSLSRNGKTRRRYIASGV